MRRTWGCWLGALMVVSLSGMALAAGAATAKLIEEGDQFYAKREQAGAPKKAVEAYQKVLSLDPSSAEAYWKLARVYYWMGTHAANSDAALDQFKEGIEYGKLAVEADPKSVGAQFWLGVSYGKYGETRGIMQSLHLVPYLKDAMEKSLAINPAWEKGGAHRVLCRMYMKLPSFKGGSIEKSIEHCKKALQYGPKNLMNHRFMAETYIEAKRNAEARQELQTVIDLPLEPGLEPESREEQTLARKLLDGLK